MELPKCVICGKTDNLMPMRSIDFHRTCFEHRSYAGKFQILLLPNGDIRNLPEMKCDFCGKFLSVDERLTLKAYHFSKTCSEHRQFGSHFNTAPIRQRMGFRLN